MMISWHKSIIVILFYVLHLDREARLNCDYIITTAIKAAVVVFSYGYHCQGRQHRRDLIKFYYIHLAQAGISVTEAS